LLGTEPRILHWAAFLFLIFRVGHLKDLAEQLFRVGAGLNEAFGSHTRELTLCLFLSPEMTLLGKIYDLQYCKIYLSNENFSFVVAINLFRYIV
jgi:hypothetical protein